MEASFNNREIVVKVEQIGKLLSMLGSTGCTLRCIEPGHAGNGRLADYFIHLLLGVRLLDALVRATIWIQRIQGLDWSMFQMLPESSGRLVALRIAGKLTQRGHGFGSSSG